VIRALIPKLNYSYKTPALKLLLENFFSASIKEGHSGVNFKYRI
jgi:hypothetical protein